MALVVQPLAYPGTLTPTAGSTFYSYDITDVPTDTKAIIVRLARTGGTGAFQFGMFHPDSTTRTRYYSGNYVGQWLFASAASVTGTTATIVVNRASTNLTLYTTHYIAGDITLFTQPVFMTVPSGYTSWNSFDVTDAGVPSNAAYALITLNAVTTTSVVGLRPVEQTTWDSRVGVVNSAGSFMVPLDGSGNFGLVAPQNAVIAVLGYLMPEQGLAYTPVYTNTATTGWHFSGSGRSLWLVSTAGGGGSNYATGWRRSSADTTVPFNSTAPARGGFWQHYMTSTEHQAYIGSTAVDIYAWGSFRIQGAGSALASAQVSGTATVAVPAKDAAGTTQTLAALTGTALVLNPAVGTITTQAQGQATPLVINSAVSAATAQAQAQAGASVVGSAGATIAAQSLGGASALVLTPAQGAATTQALAQAIPLAVNSAQGAITTQALVASQALVLNHAQGAIVAQAVGQAAPLVLNSAVAAVTSQALAQAVGWAINPAASAIATHVSALAAPVGSTQGSATVETLGTAVALGTIVRLGAADATAQATTTAQALVLNLAIGQAQVVALGTASALVINLATATAVTQANLAATAIGTTSASVTVATQAMGAAATSVIRSVVANTQAQALTDALGQAVKLAQAQALTAATAQAQAQGLTGAEAIAATAALVQADAALILAGAAIIAAQGQAQGVPARTVPAAVDVMAEAALMGSGYIPGQGAYAHIGLVATLAATAEAQVGLSLGPGRLTRYTRAGVMPIKRAGLKRPL